MIKIGLTPSFMYPDPARKYFWPKRLSYFEQEMIDYLCVNNILPVMLMDYPDEQLQFVLSELDGVIFSGGSDVDPKNYGENSLDHKLWPGDPVRDAFEKKVFDYSYNKSLPIMGVCRGAQFINVAMGGTLYQDLSTQVQTSICHRDQKQYDKHYHEVKFVENCHLTKIYPENEKQYINSVHHQGIKKLARDLVTEAYAPEDNTIEAFSHKNMSDQFILGVQWHPEFSKTLGDQLINPEPLYQYFLSSIR